ncbi:MAG: carbon-nitrogen hydrolase, partial [Flavobacterium sp.]
MQTKIKKVELRNLAFEDYKQLKNSMVESYPEMADSYWRADDIERLLGIFPEGQLVILADGKVVGSALSLIVDK